MIIRPYESLWEIDLKERWRYRDPIQLFVRHVEGFYEPYAHTLTLSSEGFIGLESI